MGLQRNFGLGCVMSDVFQPCQQTDEQTELDSEGIITQLYCALLI